MLAPQLRGRANPNRAAAKVRDNLPYSKSTKEAWRAIISLCYLGAEQLCLPG
jgi:hypothetical protein